MDEWRAELSRVSGGAQTQIDVLPDTHTDITRFLKIQARCPKRKKLCRDQDMLTLATQLVKPLYGTELAMWDMWLFAQRGCGLVCGSASREDVVLNGIRARTDGSLGHNRLLRINYPK